MRCSATTLLSTAKRAFQGCGGDAVGRAKEVKCVPQDLGLRGPEGRLASSGRPACARPSSSPYHAFVQMPTCSSASQTAAREHRRPAGHARAPMTSAASTSSKRRSVSTADPESAPHRRDRFDTRTTSGPIAVFDRAVPDCSVETATIQNTATLPTAPSRMAFR